MQLDRSNKIKRKSAQTGKLIQRINLTVGVAFFLYVLI